MEDTVSITARDDHPMQWVALKRAYAEKRGSNPGRSGKAIPRTLYRDIAQLTRWWQTELERELKRNPFLRDNDIASRKRWLASKERIDRQLAEADPSTVYPENEWFWEESRRLSLYLGGRKAVPSNAELLVESFRETLAEHAEAAKDIAKGAAGAITGAGDRARSLLKTGALIIGGIAGAAIVLPPIIRALRSDR